MREPGGEQGGRAGAREERGPHVVGAHSPPQTACAGPAGSGEGQLCLTRIRAACSAGLLHCGASPVPMERGPSAREGRMEGGLGLNGQGDLLASLAPLSLAFKGDLQA